MGSEKRSGATSLTVAELWFHTIGRDRRRLAGSGLAESCLVPAEDFEAEAAKLNLDITATSNIVASTKYPALRHADSRNNAIPP
jgi:hypothetical protein